MLSMKKEGEKKATAPCHSPQVLWVLVPSLLGKVILNGEKKFLGEAVLIQPTISHKALHSPLNCGQGTLSL